MISLKTPQEIELIQAGGQKLAEVMERILLAARPKTKLAELEELACQEIEAAGGEPAFKKVKDYHWATCLNINEGIVHGVPGDYRLKAGDLLSVDIGMLYQDWNTDMARTVEVKNSFGPSSGRGQKSNLKNQKISPLPGFQKLSPYSEKPEANVQQPMARFIQVGWETLEKAIVAAQPGNRLGHISEAIETGLKAAGYDPVRALTGHGIGKDLHEEPSIPTFVDRPLQETPLLEPGMVLAIEVIYAAKSGEIKINQDGWTVVTRDGSPAGLFEDMIAVTEKGPLICTRACPPKLQEI